MLHGWRVIVPVLGLLSFCSILYLYISPLGHLRVNRPTGPTHAKANAPAQSIVAFWAQWSRIIEAGRPAIEPIEIVWNAKVESPKNVTGSRKPTPQSIGLKKEEVTELREKHAYIVGHPEFNELDERARTLYHGTGIVITAGGSLLPPAILSIRLLRKTHSTLPIHVFMQSHEYEQEACEEILPALDAECYIMDDYLDPDTTSSIKTYQLKPLAILFSKFASVIWLDADSIALQDPGKLMTAEPYTSQGLVLWPDYWLSTEDRVFYEIAGVPFSQDLPPRSCETGQLLVDKTRHLSTLMLATYYNIYGPEAYYQIFAQGAPGEGDKETFLAAAAVLNKTYYQVKKKPQALGYREERTGEFHGQAIMQGSPLDDFASRNNLSSADVKLFFLHASTPKLNAADLLYGKGLQMPETGEDIRIWGSKEDNEKRFGYDIERSVWEEMVDMACTLRSRLENWKSKKNLCQKARRHFDTVFG